MRKLLLISCVLGALAFAARPMSAQSKKDPRTAVIEGNVETQSGKPALHAVVFLQPADGEAPHGTKTDDNGHFVFRHLKQGIYELRAESPLLTSDWERDINLKPAAKLNITLHLRVPRPAPQP
ncbi:MAG TPA: carboxypeptidase-like regulatory domain-containing protein [Candidatus Acidoferrales bacterium]|nr:carboxypeptidase-like regulatory domain-containing protein [Candidatus Acidoferrales bacterium]